MMWSCGDFIMWTKGDIAVERIVRDCAFYEDALKNMEHVYVYGILLEVNLFQWYTRTPIVDSGVLLPPDHKWWPRRLQ